MALLDPNEAPAASRLLRLMNTTRLLGAGLATLLFAALGLLWQWPMGLAVSGIALGVVVHAAWRRTRVDRRPTDILLVDITAIAAILLIAEPPLVVMIPAIAASLVTALLLLPGKSAALVVSYLTVMIMAAAAGVRIGGTREWALGETVILTAAISVVFLPFMALLLRAAARLESDRERVSQGLRASEQRHTSLLDGLPVGVYRTTPEGRIVDANPALAQMLGFADPETLLATSFDSFYVDPAERVAWVSELRRRGTVTDHLTRLRRHNGSLIWARESGRVRLGPDGSIAHYEGTIEDITQEVRLAAYEKAVARFAQALLTEQSEGAITAGLAALLDAFDADVVFARRNVEHPTLGPASILVYETSRNSDPPDHERWHLVPWSARPALHEHLRNGEPHTLILSELSDHERSSYHCGPASMLFIPITIDEGWLGFVGFGDRSGDREWSEHDVTVAQTVAHLIGAAWGRQDQQLRLEHLVQSRDRFVASVSHRLRTPLTTVVGVSQLLRNPEAIGESERDQFIEDLAAQSLEVANVVEDLLVAARTDIGTITLNATVMDLRSAVDAAIGALPTGTLLSIEIDDTSVVASADSMRVRQILRNLLDNANRYGGPNVRVHFANGGARVRVQVSDDGAGLDTDAPNPFHPVGGTLPADGPPGPLGLGLMISYRLADMMGGDLTYQRSDERTIFTLDLPAA